MERSGDNRGQPDRTDQRDNAESGATAVWLITAAGCHELIPDDAIELGPPQS